MGTDYVVQTNNKLTATARIQQFFLQYTAAGNKADVLPNQSVYVERTEKAERMSTPQN
jgi:hypothetical protein